MREVGIGSVGNGGFGLAEAKLPAAVIAEVVRVVMVEFAANVDGVTALVPHPVVEQVPAEIVDMVEDDVAVAIAEAGRRFLPVEADVRHGGAARDAGKGDAGVGVHIVLPLILRRDPCRHDQVWRHGPGVIPQPDVGIVGQIFHAAEGVVGRHDGSGIRLLDLGLEVTAAPPCEGDALVLRELMINCDAPCLVLDGEGWDRRGLVVLEAVVGARHAGGGSGNVL